MKRASTLAAVLAAVILAGCQGGSSNVTAEANTIAEDPYGATGAPGADLTDNGVTDGASGLADNAAENPR